MACLHLQHDLSACCFVYQMRRCEVRMWFALPQTRLQRHQCWEEWSTVTSDPLLALPGVKEQSKRNSRGETTCVRAFLARVSCLTARWLAVPEHERWGGGGGGVGGGGGRRMWTQQLAMELPISPFQLKFSVYKSGKIAHVQESARAHRSGACVG